jgi:DNA-binding XRE family transcriptional regulator
MGKNSLKKIRESILMSTAELARKANISPITISRIEQGFPCRVETKKKIIKALGYKLSERDKIFPEDQKPTSLNIKKRTV